MKQPSHQTELPLANEPVTTPMPQEVLAECRQLLGQMLSQVLAADKEVHDEH